MWREEELGLDEPTKVFEREPNGGPKSGPLLLVKRVVEPEPYEIVDVVELGRPALPPPRRRTPPPPAPSLAEATPTRPGTLGYTNEFLFVEVTPPAFTLDAIAEPPLDASHPDDDRSSVSLEPAVFDTPMRRPAPRVGLGLKLGAMGAVALALVSYWNGPITADAFSASRAAFLLRSSEKVQGVATAAPESATKKRARNPTRRRGATRKVPVDRETSVEEPAPDDDVTAREEVAEATPDANDAEPIAEAASDDVSETEAKLTEALAPPFNVGAARAALGGLAASASACGDGERRGSARVAVTFAHSGSATAAVVEGGSALAGTAVGSCVARVMRQAAVPAYSGEMVTVRTRVTVR